MPDEPIDRDELLYRRVIHNHYKQGDPTLPLPYAALKPEKRDITGLSLFRNRYRTAESIVRPGRPDYVAVFHVGTLLDNGINVVISEAGGSGHVEIPDVTYDRRKDIHVTEIIDLMTKELYREVLGPFNS